MCEYTLWPSLSLPLCKLVACGVAEAFKYVCHAGNIARSMHSRKDMPVLTEPQQFDAGGASAACPGQFPLDGHRCCNSGQCFVAFCGTVLAHLHDMSLCQDSQPAAAFDSQMQCSAQASVPVRQLSVHAYAWNDILVAGSMRKRFWSK